MTEKQAAAGPGPGSEGQVQPILDLSTCKLVSETSEMVRLDFKAGSLTGWRKRVVACMRLLLGMLQGMQGTGPGIELQGCLPLMHQPLHGTLARVPCLSAENLGGDVPGAARCDPPIPCHPQ